MTQAKTMDAPLRIGLLLAALSWFTYNIYDFFLGVYNRHTTGQLAYEDIPASLGTSCVVAASLIVVIIVLFYALKRGLSKSEAFMAFRMILVFEIGYFSLSFWPSIFVEGIPGVAHFTLAKVFELTIPSLVEVTLIPVVLAKLFFELNPNKPAANQMKWGLIAGTSYLFVFWLGNAGNWIGAVVSKGFDYIAQYPINMLSFILTTIGLFLLPLYTAYFTKTSIQKSDLTPSSIDLKKVGLIITGLGGYLVFIFLLYLFFGSVGGWGSWYAWFLGHGYLDLWALTLPFIGLCLQFTTSTKIKDANKVPKRYALNNKIVNLILFVTQGLGVAFYIVFSAAYDIPLPSTKVLTGQPFFHNLLMITGTSYFVFILLVIGLSIIGSIKE
ncbi:MAG TPA: hypothetical protein VLU95_06110 [Candidatus Acidoferrum sp.]|nr:hypothetical protein [Candidatus Acidoferrum sp.]